MRKYLWKILHYNRIHKSNNKSLMLLTKFQLVLDDFLHEFGVRLIVVLWYSYNIIAICHKKNVNLISTSLNLFSTCEPYMGISFHS